MRSEGVVPFLIFCVYGAVGSVLFRFWLRSRHVQRPTSHADDPVAYWSYWLPALVWFEVYALGGGALFILLLYRASPMLRGSDGYYSRLGFGLGIVLVIVLFALLDLVIVVRKRRATRTRSHSTHGDTADTR